MSQKPRMDSLSSKQEEHCNRRSLIERTMGELSRRAGGVALSAQKVQTPAGIRSVDVVWISAEQLRTLLPAVLPEMPEVCVEVLEAQQYLPIVKTAECYVEDGANEVWVITPDGKRLRFQPSNWEQDEAKCSGRDVDSAIVRLTDISELQSS